MVVPLMFVTDVAYGTMSYILGALTMMGFMATYLDWHSPYWRPEQGIIITSPPMIFKNWLRTWALQHFIMKFPFDLFVIWMDQKYVINGLRLLRLINISALVTKFSRIKEKRSLQFGIIMQVSYMMKGQLYEWLQCKMHRIGCREGSNTV